MGSETLSAAIQVSFNHQTIQNVQTLALGSPGAPVARPSVPNFIYKFLPVFPEDGKLQLPALLKLDGEPLVPGLLATQSPVGPGNLHSPHRPAGPLRIHMSINRFVFKYCF